MPEQVTSGLDAWDDFASGPFYPGYNDGDGINEAFEAVALDGRVVVADTNRGSDSERHTTVGTGRSEPYGTTSCGAFSVQARNATEFPTPTDWLIAWQLQMSGSPIVDVELADTAVDADTARDEWAYRSRSGSDSGVVTHLLDLAYGRWTYFVSCQTLVDTGGRVRVWAAHDGWPDVTAMPLYERFGHDTWQGTTGHQTLGIYSASSSLTHTAYFERYGRSAGDPARAIALAGTP